MQLRFGSLILPIKNLKVNRLQEVLHDFAAIVSTGSWCPSKCTCRLIAQLGQLNHIPFVLMVFFLDLFHFSINFLGCIIVDAATVLGSSHVNPLLLIFRWNHTGPWIFWRTNLRTKPWRINGDAILSHGAWPSSEGEHWFLLFYIYLLDIKLRCLLFCCPLGLFVPWRNTSVF